MRKRVAEVSSETMGSGSISKGVEESSEIMGSVNKGSRGKQ